MNFINTGRHRSMFVRAFIGQKKPYTLQNGSVLQSQNNYRFVNTLNSVLSVFHCSMCFSLPE